MIPTMEKTPPRTIKVAKVSRSLHGTETGTIRHIPELANEAYLSSGRILIMNGKHDHDERDKSGLYIAQHLQAFGGKANL